MDSIGAYEAEATRFVSLLATLPINLDLASPAMTTVLAAGRRHKLSAHAAAYFVLAARDGIPLATRDRGLRAAAKTAGIPLVIDGAA